MNWRISILLILSLLVACKNVEPEKNSSNIQLVPQGETEYFSTKHLIEAAELQRVAKGDSLILIDFRKPEFYLEEHLEGAVNIWRPDIEDSTYPYNGIIASKEQIENLFSKLGIKNNSQLVVYDDMASCDATRFWWGLKYYGFENVKILNGGLTAWKTRNGKLTSQVKSMEPSNFEFLDPQINTMLYSSLENMVDATKKSKRASIILDTRTLNEFSGKRRKSGASRGGRIPGSILVDWANAVDYNNTKEFKTYKELLELYDLKGVSKNSEVYVYCHSGVRSAHTTFVLTELLGFKNVKNFDGSWVEWSYNKELPIEKDSITTIY